MTTRGRKALPRVEAAVVEVNEEQLQHDIIAADQLAGRLEMVDAQFGDGLKFDAGRIENEVRFFVAQASTSIFEAGRRLVLLKEHHAHGDWMECLGRLDMAPRAAQRLIQLAVRFQLPNASTSTHFEKLGKSKLIELTVLDDEEIKELAKGGTVLDLTLDEVDRMSVSELRRALREATEEKTAKDRLLAEKNEKLDALQSRPLASKTWDEAAHALIQESDSLFTLLQEYLTRLVAVQEQIMAADFGDATDTENALRFCAVSFGDKLTRTSQMLSSLRSMHDRALGNFSDQLDDHPVDYDVANGVIGALGGTADSADSSVLQ